MATKHVELAVVSSLNGSSSSKDRIVTNHLCSLTPLGDQVPWNSRYLNDKTEYRVRTCQYVLCAQVITQLLCMLNEYLLLFLHHSETSWNTACRISPPPSLTPTRRSTQLSSHLWQLR